jgi:hypothetical protein
MRRTDPGRIAAMERGVRVALPSGGRDAQWEERMHVQPSPPSGHKLLNAVERMIARPAAIEAVVADYAAEHSDDLEALSRRIISHYSNRSALAGGLAALPGMVPGLGTLTVAFGTSLADMALVLKLEVELVLALARAHGVDIREPGERRLAFLVAAVNVAEVESGRNVLLDIGSVSLTALRYTPREIEKHLLHVFGVIAIALATKYVPRGVVRAVPFVGIAVGAGLNKALTARVGRNAQVWYAWRRGVRVGVEGAR